jgi:hypothetical protein
MPSSTTLYTVTTTDPNTGCSSHDTVTVFVENCKCNKNPYTKTTMNQKDVNLLSAAAEHSFNNLVTTINGNTTIQDKVFYFAPNCSLVVASGFTLTLKHCHLLACTDMWQGIIVQPGGSLVVETNSMIEDAFAAIACDGWNLPTTTPTNSLTVNGCVFNRNQTGIEISGFQFASTPFPATIKNAVFTSRYLPTSIYGPFGGNNWITSATPAGVKTILSEPILQTPYALAYNWTTANLKPPMNTVVGNYGISLNHVGWSNTNHTSTLPTSYSEIAIGDATSTTNLNLFDNLYYGIYAVTSNFTCENNAFENMHSYPIKNPTGVSYPNAGTGIYATNNLKEATYSRARVIYPNYSPSINPNTNNANYYTPQYNNKFYDCVTAVNVQSYQEVHVAGADIRSTQVYTSLPNPTIPPAGKNGILVNSPVYTYNYFRYNLITNITNGIAFTAGTTTSGIITPQGLGRISADYNNITAYFNTLPSNGNPYFVGNAIALDNSLNCYSSTTGASGCPRNADFWVSANKNNIQNVYRGIEIETTVQH